MSKKPTYEELEKRIQKLEAVEFERKRIEKELIHLHNLTDYIIGYARSSIAVHDRDLNYLYVSKRYLEDYKVKDKNIIGKHHYEVFPDLPQKWRDVHQRSLKGEVLTAKEDPFYRDDGSIDWTRWESRPWYEADGRIGGIIIYTEIINDRRQIEENLRKSEKRFSFAMEFANDGLFDWNLETNEIYYSPVWKRLLGYADNELPNDFSVWETLVHSEDAKRSWKMLNELINKKRDRFEIEFKMKHKNGRWVDILSRANAIFDENDKAIRIIGTHLDITEKKRIEEELRSSEHYYRNLFNNTNEGLFTMTLDGQLVEVNKAFADMHGYSIDELKQMKIQELDVFKNDALCEKIDITNRVLAGEVVRFEVDHFHKNGQRKRLHVTSSLVEISNQKYYLSFHQDITEQKKLQSRLQQAQKMESIGSLAGGIAHDFNNILFPIVGLAEILVEDLPVGSLERENAEEIKIAGQRGADLAKQILAFSRQDEHKFTPESLQRIIKEVIKLSRAAIPMDIELSHSLQSDCGLILADAVQLHQIGMNLITNAYHGVQEKGGKIDVTVREIEVNEVLDDLDLPCGKYATLTVTDDGIGIPREHLDKIFEPYFTTKEKGKGTGLGLSVVYGIVKEHEGKIKVISEPGKGTSFQIYLPIISFSNVTDTDNAASIFETGNEHILLVDDELPIARLEKQILERFGYTVSEFTSSTDALEAFKNHPDNYDLVITDMSMPYMTGDQLAYEIRKISLYMPIIICTGFSERVNEDRAEEIGVNGFLMKPIVKSDMATMIRKVLDEAMDIYKE